MLRIRRNSSGIDFFGVGTQIPEYQWRPSLLLHFAGGFPELSMLYLSSPSSIPTRIRLSNQSIIKSVPVKVSVTFFTLCFGID